MDNSTDRLARFFTETPYEAIPDQAIHEARRAIIDGLGVGLGGVDHPAAGIVLRYAGQLGGIARAQVWGRHERLPIELAALVNGFQEHVLDFDDTYLPAETVLHGTVPLLPGLFALAEARNLSGRSILRSFVLGFEAEARLALALGRAHYTAGWHVTATTGPVGGAVAVGTLIGLSAEQLRHAIGIALSHSGGFTAMLGSMTKAYHAGKSAEAGVRAALLAELGLDSTFEPITHPQGYLNVAASDQASERLTDQLGERYIIIENGYKPYASGVVSHPIIDAMAQLGKDGLRAEQVERVDAWVNPFVVQVTGQQEPKTGLEGKFSSYHCGAVGLIDGTARKAQFTDARVLDPQVVDLRRRIVLITEESLRKDECRVLVTLRDGSTRTKVISHASGTADNPVSDGEIGDKFLDLAGPVLGSRRDHVLKQLWQLDRLADFAALAPDLAGDPEANGERIYVR